MDPEGAPASGVAGREPTRRLFFALWPDGAMREAMAQATRKAARASGGRPLPMENLHITLAFLGSVPARQLPQLAETARAAASAVTGARAPASAPDGASETSLELAFDHLEYWRGAQLLCALPTEQPVLITNLARRLQDLLTRGGFAPDLKPFRPHVTVARKVVRPAPVARMHPVVWRFRELALIESRTLPQGALYSVVELFPLCGPQKSANNSEMA